MADIKLVEFTTADIAGELTRRGITYNANLTAVTMRKLDLSAPLTGDEMTRLANELKAITAEHGSPNPEPRPISVGESPDEEGLSEEEMAIAKEVARQTLGQFTVAVASFVEEGGPKAIEAGARIGLQNLQRRMLAASQSEGK